MMVITFIGDKDPIERVKGRIENKLFSSRFSVKSMGKLKLGIGPVSLMLAA